MNFRDRWDGYFIATCYIQAVASTIAAVKASHLKAYFHIEAFKMKHKNYILGYNENLDTA